MPETVVSAARQSIRFGGKYIVVVVIMLLVFAVIVDQLIDNEVRNPHRVRKSRSLR
jgi:hypothetical protein